MPILTPPAAFNLPSRITLAPLANTQSGGRSPANGSEQTLELPGGRWGASLAWEGLTQNEWRPIMAFLANLGGRAGRFTWRPPLVRQGNTGSDGGMGPRILIGGQTGKSIRTTGWAATGYVARAGDLIGWADPAGRAQLHMVTADVAAAEATTVNAVPNPRGIGAIVGTPGAMPTGWAIMIPAGLSIAVPAYGDWDGLTTVDVRWFGTTTAAGSIGFWFHGGNDAAAAALLGQAWTASAYIGLAAGSMANISAMAMTLIERTTAAAYVNEALGAAFTPVSGSREAQRRTSTKTISGATTTHGQAAFRSTVASGVAIDVTLRICAPQLERGAAATSVILPTAGTIGASTRTQDISIPIAPAIRRSPSADALLAYDDTGPGAVWRLTQDRAPMDLMRGLIAGGSIEIEEALV